MLVIVGGGPAGLGAARTYRARGGLDPVLMLSADNDPPYYRPALTKEYLSDEIGEDELWLQAASWYVEQNIELRLQCVVSRIDPSRRLITLTDSTMINYDRLVLATGAQPRLLPVPGGDLPGIIRVREKNSSEQLRALRGGDQRVAVIGSGFIGCEAAAGLARSGTQVDLVTDEHLPHQARLGPDAGRQIAAWLREDGVTLHLGSGVSQIKRSDGQWRIGLADGSSLVDAAVVAAIGAAPRVDLARAAGLTLTGARVETDAGLRTSDPRIWAAGDIAAAFNPAAGRRLAVEHWGEAESMGEVVGTNLAGGSAEWTNVPGFWSSIGGRTLKYSAWGDGYDDAQFAGDHDSWAVWYSRGGLLVGLLAHHRDELYDASASLIEQQTPVVDLFGS